MNGMSIKHTTTPHTHAHRYACDCIMVLRLMIYFYYFTSTNVKFPVCDDKRVACGRHISVIYENCTNSSMMQMYHTGPQSLQIWLAVVISVIHLNGAIVFFWHAYVAWKSVLMDFVIGRRNKRHRRRRRAKYLCINNNDSLLMHWPPK